MIQGKAKVHAPVKIEVQKQFEEQPKDLSKFIYFEGWASTTGVDRIGDIIASAFWQNEKALQNFGANPVLLYNHNFDEVVGNIYNYEISENGLYVWGKVSRNWERAWSVDEGFLKTLSVHITVEDYEYLEEANAFAILEGELLEISLASVPMNAGATFDLSKSLDTDRSELKKHFINKNKNMNIQTIMKTLLALITAKFGVDLGFSQDAEIKPEDLQKKLEELPDHEARQKEFESKVLNDFKDEIIEGKTDSAKSIRKSLIDEIKAELVAETKDAFQADIDSLKAANEDLKNQLAKLKGIEGDQGTTSDPFKGMPSSQKHFVDQFGTIQPPNKEA